MQYILTCCDQRGGRSKLYSVLQFSKQVPPKTISFFGSSMKNHHRFPSQPKMPITAAQRVFIGRLKYIHIKKWEFEVEKNYFPPRYQNSKTNEEFYQVSLYYFLSSPAPRQLHSMWTTVSPSNPLFYCLGRCESRTQQEQSQVLGNNGRDLRRLAEAGITDLLPNASTERLKGIDSIGQGIWH